MKSEEVQFSDEAYEKALPLIQKTYDISELEEFKMMSPNYMPSDVYGVLVEAQKEIDQRDGNYKIAGSTHSKDGKTCDYCKSELVVRTAHVKAGDKWFEEKVFACPNGGISCRTRNITESITNTIKTNREKIEGMEVYVENTRHMDKMRATKKFMLNAKDFIVTAPNTDFTEITYGMTEIFRQDLLKGESKRTKKYIVCQHVLNKEVDMENGTVDASSYETKNGYGQKKPIASRHYRPVSVKQIGKLGFMPHQCNECNNISEKLRHMASYNPSDPEIKEFEDRWRNVVHYQVELQRIDSEIEKDIINVLRNIRLKGDSQFYKADQIFEKTISHFTWLVHRGDKAFYNARLKKLANKKILEVNEVNWEFGYAGQKYGNYLDNAKKLNHYRWFNPYAVFVTGKIRKFLEDYRQTTSHSEEDKKYRSKIFDDLARQFGISENEIFIGRTDGQISLYCKVKKK